MSWIGLYYIMPHDQTATISWAINTLLTGGFDVNSKDIYGRTPWHNACENKYWMTMGRLQGLGRQLAWTVAQMSMHHGTVQSNRHSQYIPYWLMKQTRRLMITLNAHLRI